MIKRYFLCLLVFTISYVSASQYNGRYGWPVQKAPKEIILCKQGDNLAESMLVESLSGLAAQAVNNKKFDKMIWIDVNSNSSYNKIYNHLLKDLGISSPTTMNLWDLVVYLKRKNVIKGYILYKADKHRENAYASYTDTDYSSNVATVYSGLLKGILIEESLEDKAISLGLKCLRDVRKESLDECFLRNKDELNNSSALSIPPTVTNLRDYAISHKLMLYADKKELIDKVLEWVKPLSPILGWGCGDEYDFTSLISQWGHVNTATNWCWNLPLISSMASKVRLEKNNEISPKDINFRDTLSYHSFVMSDGDNMQWTMGSFLDNTAYLGGMKDKNVNLSWTLCPIELSVVSPYTWNSLVKVKTNAYSYLEYGGGYQYPDLFAVNRPNRKELLRDFAKRVNIHLNELGIKIFGFICRDVASPAAQEAFQIYAEELEGITGMVAVQYFPYELDGSIYWKKNKEGIDIPIVTSRYSIWDEVNLQRPRAGTPEYVASLINRDVMSNINKGDNMLTWTIVHAWSDFTNSSKLVSFPSIGVNPVQTAQSLLINKIKTISLNELLWRIRMKYRPQQTIEIINSEY